MASERPDVKQQIAAHWDRRAPHFDDDFGHSIRTTGERAAWDRIFDLVLTGRRALDALDAGCGTGLLSFELAARGHHVTGVDFAPAMIAEARRKSVERGSSHGAIQPPPDSRKPMRILGKRSHTPPQMTPSATSIISIVCEMMCRAPRPSKRSTPTVGMHEVISSPTLGDLRRLEHSDVGLTIPPSILLRADHVIE